MSEVLLYEQFGKVVKLTINRPEKRNAMNHAVIQGLHDAFDKIAEDDSVRGFFIYKTKYALLLLSAHYLRSSLGLIFGKFKPS